MSLNTLNRRGFIGSLATTTALATAALTLPSAMHAQLALNRAIAQETTIINDSIFSKVLNEQRKIKIYLPEEYKPGSDSKYDVVYLVSVRKST